MDRPDVSNQVLLALGADARAAISAAGQRVRLEPGETLNRARHAIEHVVFVETGFLSVLFSAEGPDGVEVGLIGREGVSGLSVALGFADSPFSVVVRAAGAGYRMPVEAFRHAIDDHPDLRRAVFAYWHAFTTMVAETCRANARLSVEARLARWLMMAHDRLESDDLPITHEILSQMLGVRRPGVTVALHMLEGERMIRARRGLIQILDRDKLGAVVRGSYARPDGVVRPPSESEASSVP